MINQPAILNFPPHYRGDGFTGIEIQLEYIDENDNPSGEFIDLTGAQVHMQLKNKISNNIVWEFSNVNNINNSNFTLIYIIDAVDGIIEFPEIKEWILPSTIYKYDMQVKDSSGFVRTYLKGIWSVNQDITTI